jgi:small ligand-binding sensory domain FIST
MWFLKMHDLLGHLSQLSDLLPAILVTIGVAMLIGCAVGCVCTPCEEKDDLFHKEVY